MGVKNLIFEGENRNNKVENENKIIKDKEQAELRAVISDNLPFIIVISRRQGSKGVDNNMRKYNLRRLVREIK